MIGRLGARGGESFKSGLVEFSELVVEVLQSGVGKRLRQRRVGGSELEVTLKGRDEAEVDEAANLRSSAELGVF